MVHLLLAIIYLSFISLGLPDSLLGAAWPSMVLDLQVTVSSAGILSMLIAGCTILSSLFSNRLVQWLNTGKVTALSVAMTAVALYGFSISTSFWQLCLWAMPYGLGAGSVDAALNNYVALHYQAKHMSWLHCFWGVGASLGPAILGTCMTYNLGWNQGYGVISIIQLGLTLCLFLSLPLWKKEVSNKDEIKTEKPLSMNQLLRLKGAKQTLLAFFCYCAMESACGLWAASYMVVEKGISLSDAASFAGLFFLGITIGRFFSGFLATRYHSDILIRLGQILVALGIVFLLVGSVSLLFVGGLVLVGLGCAPIYPNLLHQTPQRFGKQASQAMMGVQMACAYVGSTFIPPLVGLLCEKISFLFLPFCLLAIVILMVWMTEKRPSGQQGQEQSVA